MIVACHYSSFFMFYKFGFFTQIHVQVRLQSATSTKELHSVKWEMETLRMRCDAVTEERDELKTRFGEIVMEMQQKNGLKSVLLERKLCQLRKEYERLEVVLGEVLKVTGFEPQEFGRKIGK